MSNRTLKIAHLTSAHPRFDVRIFHKMARSAAARGFDVSIVVADGKPDEKSHGVNIINVNAKKEARFARIIKSAWRVYRIAKDLSADIYHLHDPELLPYAWKLKKMGKTVIFDAHEDFPKQLLSKPYLHPVAARFLSSSSAIFEKFVCKQLDQVIGATPMITAKFAEYTKATNVNNYPIIGELAVGKDDFASKPREIIFLGGISHIRGVGELVDAMSQVENVTLNLVGNISSSTFKQSLESKRGWSAVNEWGLVERETAAEALARSKIGLVTFLPVPNHIESQPNKMFEYMSAGLPIITSNFPMWRDVVEKYECGLCVDPEDPQAIASAIMQLLDNPAEAQAMGDNGSNAVNTVFNWEAESKKLIDLYTELSL
ncbi:glycosyl transferase [Pseudoalteromonas rubra]|uniref:Glycosyl transferase n=1 Tax=Pseudoalteromonas rubra TaxID=43658 RepID=A0A5S3WR59_9GAMM|nr:glycosyltransferase family 4 protein [Pseudoalteromonas rubra]TMP31445.1 glycosyl transferase [Pseudoalteromonas rubra]TMP34530.1 glycosyl transferase [Pseudoalteromonas rubra]